MHSPCSRLHNRSSCRDKHNCQRRDSNLDPLTPQSDALTTRLLRPAKTCICRMFEWALSRPADGSAAVVPWTRLAETLARTRGSPITSARITGSRSDELAAPETRRRPAAATDDKQRATTSSAVADGPRDPSCQLKSRQLPRNSAETTCTTSPEQIEVMKLEGYRGPMCNKHVHSTMTRSSRFHCLIGVINKPTTDELWNITSLPTTCCGEIF